MNSTAAVSSDGPAPPDYVQLGGRQVHLRLSPSARAQLARETGSLEIELEVYFSCYLRKRVRFLRAPHEDVVDRVALSDHVNLSVRMVMTRACLVADASAEPELDALPVIRRRAFVPRWVSLHYTGGAWFGEFGFRR